MRFAFIAVEKAHHSVVSLCRHLGVSTSGFYAWDKRKPSARAMRDKRLTAEILAIHRQKKGRYGSPRMHAELVARGFKVCRATVVRLMRENGIRANRKRPFRIMTTDSSHGLTTARNVLERTFVASKPDETWVGDITHIVHGVRMSAVNWPSWPTTGALSPAQGTTRVFSVIVPDTWPRTCRVPVWRTFVHTTVCPATAGGNSYSSVFSFDDTHAFVVPGVTSSVTHPFSDVTSSNRKLHGGSFAPSHSAPHVGPMLNRKSRSVP